MAFLRRPLPLRLPLPHLRASTCAQVRKFLSSSSTYPSPPGIDSRAPRDQCDIQTLLAVLWAQRGFRAVLPLRLGDYEHPHPPQTLHVCARASDTKRIDAASDPRTAIATIRAERPPGGPSGLAHFGLSFSSLLNSLRDRTSHRSTSTTNISPPLGVRHMAASPETTTRAVTVFCGSSNGAHPAFAKAAQCALSLLPSVLLCSAAP